MKLPHLQNAVVQDQKLSDYLLSTTHEDGAGKAAFFLRFGYTQANRQELAQALLNHAAEHDILNEEATPFGTRFVIEGELCGLDGRRPNLRSVWFIDSGSETPRLITAYPIEARND